MKTKLISNGFWIVLVCVFGTGAFGPGISFRAAAAEYASYSGPDAALFTDIAMHSDGRIVGFGEYNTTGGGIDFGVVGFDQQGTVTAATAAGGSGQDRVTCGLITQAGDLICGGYTMSFGLPYSSQMLVRFTDTGALQWARTVQFEEASKISGITRASGSDFFLCGQLEEIPKNIIVSRHTDSGTPMWCTILDDWYFSLWAECITPTLDDGCIVSGTMGSTGMENLVIFKLAADGSLDWHQHISAPFYLSGVFVHEISGSYIIGGRILDVEDMLSAFFLLKLSAGGEVDWAFRYDRTDSNLWLESMIVTTDGKYVGTGSVYDEADDCGQCLLFKLSDSGTLEWATRIGESLNDTDEIGTGAAVLPESQIAVTGERHLPSSPFLEMLVVRTGADGTIPYCDQAVPVSITATDITSLLTPYARDVTVYSHSPTVIDVTPLIDTQDMILTKTVFCNGVNVPALSRIGLLIILIGISGIIRRKH